MGLLNGLAPLPSEQGALDRWSVGLQEIMHAHMTTDGRDVCCLAPGIQCPSITEQAPWYTLAARNVMPPRNLGERHGQQMSGGQRDWRIPDQKATMDINPGAPVDGRRQLLQRVRPDGLGKLPVQPVGRATAGDALIKFRMPARAPTEATGKMKGQPGDIAIQEETDRRMVTESSTTADSLALTEVTQGPPTLIEHAAIDIRTHKPPVVPVSGRPDNSKHVIPFPGPGFTWSRVFMVPAREVQQRHLKSFINDLPAPSFR